MGVAISRDGADARGRNLADQVYLASFNTLNDVFAGITGSPSTFTEIAISPDYQVVGFTGGWLPQTSPVPEPSTYLLFCVAFASVGFVRMVRKQFGHSA